MFEGVLDKGDKDQRRYLAIRHLSGQVELDAHLVGIAQLHQLDVGTDKRHLLGQRHSLPIALIEHVTHHLRQFQNSFLCLRGVDVDEGVDIVERVHEEVGIDLKTQIFQLLFQILLLQLSQPFAVFAAAEIALDAEVGPKHQDEHHNGQNIALTHNGRRHLRTVVWTVFWTVFRTRAMLTRPIRLTEGRRFVSAHLVHRRFEAHGRTTGRTTGALISRKANQHSCHNREVQHPLMFVYQQRCQEEVMHEKQQQEHRELTPYDEHLRPIEHEVGIAQRAHIQTQ